MKYRFLSLLCFVSLLVAGCGSKDEIAGIWQLREFCYGNDCSQMEQYDIVQMWQFDTKTLPGEPLMLANVKARQVRQYDILMAWALNEAGDTLYVSDTQGTRCDTFYVCRLEADTLVLQNNMNDSLVRQTFTRI